MQGCDFVLGGEGVPREGGDDVETGGGGSLPLGAVEVVGVLVAAAEEEEGFSGCGCGGGEDAAVLDQGADGGDAGAGADGDERAGVLVVAGVEDGGGRVLEADGERGPGREVVD